MLLDVFLPLSLAFIMLSLGLGLTPPDFGRVLRMPKAFVLGFFAQVIVLPVIAYVLGPSPFRSRSPPLSACSA